MSERMEFSNRPQRAQTGIMDIPETSQQPVDHRSIAPFVRKWWADARVKLVGAFLAGLVIGQTVLGWWLNPVVWVDVPMSELMIEDKERVVLTASHLNAYDAMSPVVAQLMHGWDGDAVACDMALVTDNPVESLRLQSLAHRVNGVGCE